MDQGIKRIFMVDGHALLYRGYYAFATHGMTNAQGIPTGAIYGFCRALFDLILKEQPTHLFVAFDPGGKTFRHQLYPLYKANRPETPQEIKDALPVVQSLLQACQIPVLSLPEVEADDVIGTLATRGAQEGFDVYMVTPDKDYCQLVSPHIRLYKPKTQKEGWEVLGEREVCQKYGLQHPAQVRDYLAIMGDTSDNVPGLRGVGPVGARKLLEQYGSVENLLAHRQELALRLRERVEEAKESLPLSLDLVTIRTQLDIPWDEPAYRLQCPSMEPLKALFLQYGFHSLIRLLPRLQETFCSASPCNECSRTPAPAPAPAALTPINSYTLVTTLDHSAPILEAARAAKVVGVHCPEYESGNGPENGLALFIPPHNYYFLALPSPSLASSPLAWLRPLWEDPAIAVCGSGLKELCLLLKRHGIALNGPLYDPQLMHYLLNPEQSHLTDHLAQEYLNYTPAAPQAAPQSLFEEVESPTSYAENRHRHALDQARCATALHTLLRQALQQAQLLSLYLHVEMPLVRTLAAMEWEGIRLDVSQMRAYGQTLRQEVVALEQQIRQLADEPLLNISSPKQLGVVLFEKLRIDPLLKKGSKAYSTGEEKLSQLIEAHPIVPLILEYRGLKKLLSTYIDPLPQLIDASTGRLHTTFTQTVTATGRLSSLRPNLQNIPIRVARGRELRKAFVPRNEEFILMSADYSQIELRLMAHASADPRLLAAFRSGEDVHTATAAQIYHCAPAEVTPEQRRKAKTANFGILYGISAFGLSQRLHIPRPEAKQLIEDYFTHYPRVKDYFEQTLQTAQQRGYVETLFHRRRYIAGLNASNANLRAMAQRNAINAPIQGTAADLIKIAMNAIQEQITARGYQSRMLLQVHDELVFDVHLSEKEAMKELVTSFMERAATLLEGSPALEVPLRVEVGFGNNWLEAH